MARLKAASFDDRMTLVEHLDELRSRLIFCGIALVGVMVVCFVFNQQILDIAGAPLPPGDDQLITLSPTEPFLTTLTVVLYSSILITMPLLLYQAYAFILPALSPHEKKSLMPMLLMVPVLFILGVVFAYYVVVPAAIKFLLNFNDDNFNIQIRAREYYSFFSLSLIAVGGLFQIPVGVLAVTRLGIVTPDTLAKNRRYAILVIAVLAMLLPGTDPITMVISMFPLVLLFEFSLILARALGTPGEEKPPDEKFEDAVDEEVDDVKEDAASAARAEPHEPGEPETAPTVERPAPDPEEEDDEDEDDDDFEVREEGGDDPDRGRIDDGEDDDETPPNATPTV